MRISKQLPEPLISTEDCFEAVRGLIDAFSIKSNLYAEGFTPHKSILSAFTLCTTIGIGATALVAVRRAVQTARLIFSQRAQWGIDLFNKMSE